MAGRQPLRVLRNPCPHGQGNLFCPIRRDKMVRNRVKRASLNGEGGAVNVKTVLIIAFLAIAGLLLLKLVPVYIEQQEIAHDADELARKAAIGTAAYSKDKIENEIQNLITHYSLPEGSIQLASLEGNHSDISVKYTRNVDLLITSYPWAVETHFTHSGFN
jgi:hypothetical protein